MVHKMLKFYKKPGLSSMHLERTVEKVKKVTAAIDVNIDTEACFYIEIENDVVQEHEMNRLRWIIAESFHENSLSSEPWISCSENDATVCVFEIGPRLNFSTAFSTNAVSICRSVGLKSVKRVEFSIRYLMKLKGDSGEFLPVNETLKQKLIDGLHDKMTECEYQLPLKNFDVEVQKGECYEIDVLQEGSQALEKANSALGLSFDSMDIGHYTKLFAEILKRNPTNVECFDLAQSNSEHSRHWFFKGEMIIDSVSMPDTLMNMVINTQKSSNANNLIKFSDNSSAIEGYEVRALRATNSSEASPFVVDAKRKRHFTLTAETHNFPTGVAPFPGATTGTGGRIRDNHATGRGAHVVAGSAGYCFGNLNIPGYHLPWEDADFEYPGNFAPPLQIAIEASNGASDYGNKFGEPVILGFARSFGLKLPNNERREWIKPIMFSGGIGSIEDEHLKKEEPSKGMEVVKIGGPVYRIGVGGGAASSVKVQGDNAAELDFGAVQRGDAEMEQKLNRVIRACVEMVDENPICSIHDQGAGGNGNVLKEIAYPAGAVIRSKDFTLGDPTISTLELWGAEYQESDAVLIKKQDVQLLKKIAEREKVGVSFVGTITGDGRIILDDSKPAEQNGSKFGDEISNGHEEPASKRLKQGYPVDLPLDVLFDSFPRKKFQLARSESPLSKLQLPQNLTVTEALDRVLRLPSVASKRYLTNKVDRCVTGLIAQQQCVGPLHTPVADVAVTALSMFDTVGAATAIGEQPIKGLIDPGCGARMTIGEALTNLVFAQISDIKDIKCSGNWMWAAKLHGEGARLYDTCKAMCETMSELGIAVDGGKDSLSMAARVGDEVVKCPGELVLSLYVPCPDITKTVTPDLKSDDEASVLIHVKLSKGSNRLGGSALAQVYGQIGNESPDMDDVQMFKDGFLVTQRLIQDGKIRSGHDISDGGLITCLLEMAFSGNRGINIELAVDDIPEKALQVLFAEELGIVLEVLRSSASTVINSFSEHGVLATVVGHPTGNGPSSMVKVSVNGDVLVNEKMTSLRDVWEATSVQLERLQANASCVEEEETGLAARIAPQYQLSFEPREAMIIDEERVAKNGRPKVAVIREEGSNGDREMASSLLMAGFEVWDVTMHDICEENVKLDDFRGVVFVGGFSYADALGSAKGWAAVTLFNEVARRELENFRARDDTFSLGVCNGCQLMALIGWVGSDQKVGSKEQSVCLTHNDSGRFECRFSTVRIEKSPSIMLKNMEGSTLGIWVAHGEGKVEFRTDAAKANVIGASLAPLRYVDDEGSFTTRYPFNPNGSPDGIAAICSADGRHLAMMPHPERCSVLWQWPWMPEAWRGRKTSPWLQMFHNAYDWCIDVQATVS
ncbi:phosphoribosylformylglycinamidine synthase-like [Rhopilema esculentum]|uniref:phosphoribosylformylglycinamidine synthase-like n=1 Tax=Rhopilema esculentum TaxID=499914 RepID=UPI0031CE4C28